MSHSSNVSADPRLVTTAATNGHAAPEHSWRPATPGLGPREQQIVMVSHELRNSLAVVRAAARMLRTSAGGVGVEGARTMIDRHVGYMARHIEELLEPCLGDARGQELQLEPVDVRKFAQYAAEAAAPDCRRRGHHLAVTLAEEPIWVQADGARLEQVFSNLLANAAKYTPDGGKITLTLQRHDAWACVRVRDSGVGIAPAMLSRIFDLFMQVDSAAPCREGGRGIGLAVVRDLVLQHRGTVTATSAGPGHGSEFTVLLPLV
jgi:signal transduction histidine kinase